MTQNSSAIEQYQEELVTQFASGHAKEHAYRPALQRLMESFEDTIAVNDPKRSENGNPDFVFLKKSNHKIIRGYAEAKDIAVSLDKTEKTNQMERYGGYANLFLTDYLEFRFFRNGEKYETISLGHVLDGQLVLTPENSPRLVRELEAFLSQAPEKIRSGKRLAEIMGGKARRIRENVAIYLQQDGERDTELVRIYEMMKKLLVHDLEPQKFADMYAQTLVYGLFVARYGDSTPETFTRSEARDLVPRSNPFLRNFFDHIVGPSFDVRLGYIVDELCEIFSVSNVQEIVHKHLRIADQTSDAKDPIIHFYEDFLQEYDPAERKRMGAYYTPIPVVKFIVRHVDKILKEEFGITKGLASAETITQTVNTQPWRKKGERKDRLTKEITVPRVQVLDPAVGTATFLNETIKFIYEQFTGQEGMWPAYVHDNLVKRLHGFELMMAPYTIAHLKLGMTLRETGVENLTERLGVYLTNTLEEGIPMQPDLFSFGLAQAVSDESKYAAEIKSEQPIMVVMGNPPYSGVSSNETKYANALINKYKVEPGGQQKLQERKHWLNDDYVKFIAFAEDLIAKNGSGVVAMITNNGYLDNPTFRGMRWHLAKTFDKIYVLDLHGNAKKKEVAPDGSKDENVFDIMQGVGIILAIKTSEKNPNQLAEIYHDELYGKRKLKFDNLSNEPAWTRFALDEKSFYFVPKNITGQSEYEEGVKVNDLFSAVNIGICTQRDKVAVQPTYESILKVVTDFGLLSEGEIRKKYSVDKDGRDWKVATAKQDVLLHGLSPTFIKKINYRAFDSRWTYYTGKTKGFIAYPREKIFQKNEDKNFYLVLSRQLAGTEFRHVFMSSLPFDQCYISTFTKEGQYALPLYANHDDGTQSPNFNHDELKKLTHNLTLEYAPEDILDYIYAVLHSPKYRDKYKEFLKIDFPRVPVPISDAEFTRLVTLGCELRNLHLLKSPTVDDYATTFPVSGSGVVEYVKYVDSQVWINSEQYFGNVPELAWNFYIGGYQPAQKWLKDRKGRELTSEDLNHYQRIIKILLETDRVMKEIDKQH